jgi:hypothetical protein
MRSGIVAALLVIVLAGASLLLAGEAMAVQRNYTPGTGTSYPHPEEIAPLGNHTVWTMSLSNSLAEDWNMNVSFAFTGNSTLIVLDANYGITYERLYWGCNFNGVPVGPCGIGRQLYFTLPPGNNHNLQAIVHNNNTAIETLNDTSVSFSYVTHPNSVAGTDLSYFGGAVVTTGLLILVAGAVRSSRATVQPHQNR